MQEPHQNEEYVDEAMFDKKLSLKDKLNGFLDSKYFYAVLIVLVAVISFCLGKLNNPPNPPARNAVQAGGPYIKGGTEEEKRTSLNSNPFSPPANLLKGKNSTAPSLSVQQTASAVNSNTQNFEQVVASKNGTKYHYPNCPGAKQISETNKIIFNSIAEARAAGYTPSGNCKGLK